MGCKWACVCGGMCGGCPDRESESYFGEAEDISSQQRGFKSYDEEIKYYKEQKETYDSERG